MRLLDDAGHAASIRQALQHWDRQSDLWVFGYGSLIWHPDFDYLESHLARVHGYHRALCLWSRINRGTPRNPGLVFGLDHGGSCQGRVYRIAGTRVPDILHALWRREMASAAYVPRWLNCHTPHGPVPGLVFTINRHGPAYAPGLGLAQTLDVIRGAHGKCGPCVDYILQTDRALAAAGITDDRLRVIANQLREPVIPDRDPRPSLLA